jgi:flavin reductase (DIM6/NTAB) family NADH-FMN oxidoreductase RutF
MFIVTVAANGQRSGCLVGFAAQCSIDPPRFAVWLSDKNRTYRLARCADVLAVHVVPADRYDLAELFGGETGDETDKFSHASWHAGPGGVPVLDGVAGWFAGPILQRIETPGADHVCFVVEPADGEPAPDGARPLTFQRAKAIEPGHDA